MPEDKVAARAKRAEIDALRVKALSDEIMPLFVGVEPDIVGCVLGILVGTYFSGHNPVVRGETKAQFDDIVDRMTVAMDAGLNHPWKRRTN